MLHCIRRLQHDPYYLLFALPEYLATSTMQQCGFLVSTAHTHTPQKKGNLTVKLFKISAVIKADYRISNVIAGLKDWVPFNRCQHSPNYSK